MVKKKRNTHKQEVLARKSKMQSLEFQTSFGLRQMGAEEIFYVYAKTELEYIAKLGLTDDILNIKKLIDGVCNSLDTTVTACRGDLINSCVCIALGISRIGEIRNLTIPQKTWAELINQKLISVYFPDDKRNKVVAWAKEHGFNTSTYLGQPIIKFDKISLLIKRERIN